MKILYKVTNSLVSLAMIPVLLFLPLFRFIAVVDVSSSNIITSLIGGIVDVNALIEKATGINIEKLPEFYTIPEAYELFFGERQMKLFQDLTLQSFPQK